MFNSRLVGLFSGVCLFSLQSFCQTPDPYSALHDQVTQLVEKDTTYISSYYASFGIELQEIKTPALYHESFKWLTTPHKMGHADKWGIDCSGFAKIIYQHVYQIKLNGGSRDIFPTAKSLSRSELKEGDLVFFKVKSSSITHVGIFLQKDKFVHTSSSNGVMISSLDDPYWSKYFYSGGSVRR